MSRKMYYTKQARGCAREIHYVTILQGLYHPPFECICPNLEDGLRALVRYGAGTRWLQRENIRCQPMRVTLWPLCECGLWNGSPSRNARYRTLNSQSRLLSLLLVNVFKRLTGNFWQSRMPLHAGSFGS